ncbi:MAG: hypothetical protein L6244_04465 [Candidatus Methanoperedenaceae archaeon]|nr:hypothetical protein [Candidatus Methanoperedenaceae archaeon]
MEKFEKGTNVLIVHKNGESKALHQVKVSAPPLIHRKGNLLTVKALKPITIQ